MDTPLFELNRTYTRREIYKALGGDLVSNFPVSQGHVVYCCISQYSHPNAPEIIFVGDTRQQIEPAKRFASQSEAIPVFLRQRNYDLVYKGKFVVERYSDDQAEIIPLARKIHRLDVTAVLYLKQIDD